MDLHYELRDAALRMENGAFLQEPELLISAAAEITTLRAQVAELEKRVSLKSQEVVDVLNNAERYYADFRARIAELEREKGALAEKCEMQERHERHVFASHNSLAKRCRGLEDQVARLAAEVERLQNTT